MVTPNHIVPEWYLLPYYAILRSITFNFLGIPAKLLGVILSLGSIIMLFLVPWLDTSKVRSARFRPVYKWMFWLFLADFIWLDWIGAQVPTDAIALMGLLATIFYFAFFLIIMPLLGWFEKTKPLPTSISA